MKNLLLGAALNYGVEQIKNFVLSFRKYNTVDDIILLVTPGSMTDEVTAFFAEHKIKASVFNPLKTINPCNTRIIKYRSVIEESWMYDTILISDVRDVVFQSNPFIGIHSDNFLYCFEEDSGATIGTEQFNSFWIRNIYGQERLDEIADRPIICAGTIMGSRHRLLDLLTIMIEDLEAMSVDVMKHGMDQGILNNICYSPYASIIPITTKKNGDIVATLGVTVDGKLSKDKMTIENGVVMINGLKPAVLHQYDRSEELKSLFA